MNDQELSEKLGIVKKILHSSPGSGAARCHDPYPTGSKFYFHYQIRLTNDIDRKIIDDTRKYDKVMELYSGKKFQLEFWELALETMGVNEVASFTVDERHLSNFPHVNKKLRDFMTGKAERGESKHCCGMMSMKEQGGLGYCDLDKLLANPQPLEFIFELLKVEKPDEVRQESWIMTEDEKEKLVPTLRDEGNKLYLSGKSKEASLKYREALGILEQLVLKEKPGEPEAVELENKKIPFLLNLAQCCMAAEEYYEAVVHLNDVINKDPDNIKAHFRRAKCNKAIWNFDDAIKDYQRAQDLDSNLTNSVTKEIIQINILRREKEDEEKSRMRNIIAT